MGSARAECNATERKNTADSAVTESLLQFVFAIGLPLSTIVKIVSAHEKNVKSGGNSETSRSFKRSSGS